MELRSAPEDDALIPDPGPLVAGALVTPWLVVSSLLPHPFDFEAYGLLGLLGLLLVLASLWASRAAGERGLDAARWSCVTVLTFGAGMIGLLAGARGEKMPATYLCGECGRLGQVHEPFCFGCGAA